MLNRRQLFQGAFALGAIAFMPSLPAAKSAPRDEYGEFLERVQRRVTEIVRREGRGLSNSKLHLPMWIDPPRAEGSVYLRRVHVMLEPGGSLLQKLHFEFDEVSGSRLVW